MNIFNNKKIRDLEYKNCLLQDEVESLKKEITELNKLIENKGYKIPKTKKLIFEDESRWVTLTHYSAVLNFMNAHDIEILSIVRKNKTDGNQDFPSSYCFEIEYRLPESMKAVNFEFDSNGTSYTSQFSIQYNKRNKK